MRRGYLFILFAFMIAVITLAGSSHGSTIVVDDDWAGADHSSIDAAVDNASDQDIIWVNAGTYTESVTVRSELTIIGNGTSETIIRPTIGDAAFILDGAVLVENLSIVGNGTSPYPYSGIHINGAGATVNGCSIVNVSTGISIRANEARVDSCSLYSLDAVGIDIAWNGENATVVDNTIINCYTGISISGDSATVRRNLVACNMRFGLQISYLASPNTTVLEDNAFLGNAIFEISSPTKDFTGSNFVGSVRKQDLTKALDMRELPDLNEEAPAWVDMAWINLSTEWTGTGVVPDGVIVNGNLTVKDADLTLGSDDGPVFIIVNGIMTVENSTFRSGGGLYTIIYRNSSGGWISGSDFSGHGAITVQNDDAIVSGSTFVDGKRSLVLSATTNATVSNCTMTNNSWGLGIWSMASHNLIKDSHIYDNNVGYGTHYGVMVESHCHNNTFYNMTVSGHYGSSFDLRGRDAVVLNSTISEGYNDLSLDWSWGARFENCTFHSAVVLGTQDHAVLINNTFTRGGFRVDDPYPTVSSLSTNTIKNNNLNGRPIHYLINVSNATVSGAGQVVAYYSDNVTIRDGLMVNASRAIQIINCRDVRLIDNTIEGASYGVYALAMIGLEIDGLDIFNSDYGIYLVANEVEISEVDLDRCMVGASLSMDNATVIDISSVDCRKGLIVSGRNFDLTDLDLHGYVSGLELLYVSTVTIDGFHITTNGTGLISTGLRNSSIANGTLLGGYNETIANDIIASGSNGIRYGIRLEVGSENMVRYCSVETFDIGFQASDEAALRFEHNTISNSTILGINATMSDQIDNCSYRFNDLISNGNGTFMGPMDITAWGHAYSDSYKNVFRFNHWSGHEVDNDGDGIADDIYLFDDLGVDFAPLAMMTHSYNGTPTPPDREPLVDVTNLKDGAVIGGPFEIRGIAFDNGEIAKVEVRLGKGKWKDANLEYNTTGAEEFSYMFKKVGKNGKRTITVRAYDENGTTTESTLNIKIRKAYEEEEFLTEEKLIMVIIFLIILVLLARIMLPDRVE